MNSRMDCSSSIDTPRRKIDIGRTPPDRAGCIRLKASRKKSEQALKRTYNNRADASYVVGSGLMGSFSKWDQMYSDLPVPN